MVRGFSLTAQQLRNQEPDHMKSPKQSVQPTGGSRYGWSVFLSPWRLPLVAHAGRWPTMRAMRQTFAILLTTVSCVCARVDEQKVVEQLKVRAAVQDVTVLRQFTGSVVQTHFDPRYVVTLRIESVTPALSGLTNGSTMSFGIHSPALLFGGETPKGKTLDFVLSRETQAGTSRFFGLAVERKGGQEGPANRGQPLGSETNRTPPAAGPDG